METSRATHKVAFVIFSIMLTVIGLLALSQQPAHAATSMPNDTPFSHDNKNFFVLRAGYSYTLLSIETLSCFGGQANVHTLTSNETYALVSSKPYAGRIGCTPAYTEYAEGTLLKASGPVIYLIHAGKRQGITSPTVLACFGNSSKVTRITDNEFSSMLTHYQEGPKAGCPYSLPNGSKLLAPNGTVFVVLNGHSYGVPSEAVLNQCFGGWSGVRTTNQVEIDTMLATYSYAGAGSCPYSLAPGSKVLAPSGTVYINMNGRSYGMPSEQVLNQCYGGWANVRAVSQAEINMMLATYPDAGGAPCGPPPIAPREQRAIDWAKSQLGSTSWNGLCELMAEQAYGVRGKFASAIAHANFETQAGRMHAGDTNVPAGALAYFGPAAVNGNYGHVAISIGGGQFVSNGYYYHDSRGVLRAVGAHIITISNAYAGPYIGWAWADDGWSR